MQQVEQLKKGHIIISHDIQEQCASLKELLHPARCVYFIEDVFKIEHAKLVMREAYISEARTKYIILGGIEFTDVAQNSLLKLFEEPPKNIEFIIISPTKSNLLATVRSRLPVLNNKHHHTLESIELSLSRIEYKSVFEFLKKNARVKKNEAKILVESLFYQATVVEKLVLSQIQLDNFQKAYKLLDLNARPQSVLAMLLMSFAQGDA